jgi:hypothetical protein
MVAGAVTVGAGLLARSSSALARDEKSEKNGGLTKGDAAILRFLAAAEILESDLWLQYQELAGTQDNEVSTLASQLIPGYPAQPTGGSPLYTNAVSQLDSDMAQYIHDNTEDELSHETFINAYLASKGADTVSLDQFRTLPSSKATGANQFGRLTNLTRLSVDTSWWTRYRSSTQNPPLTFPQALPRSPSARHTATPLRRRSEQPRRYRQYGGLSLPPSAAVPALPILARVLTRGVGILLSMWNGNHAFSDWQDKAGNAQTPRTLTDRRESCLDLMSASLRHRVSSPT